MDRIRFSSLNVVPHTATSEENCMTRSVVNLADKLCKFTEHWSPKSVASFNGHDVMVVKVLGDFNWHLHEDTDDFFLVLSGELTIHFRDEDIKLAAGDLYVISKGIEHRTSSEQETHLLLIEPSGTPNTGDLSTAAIVERI